MIEGYKYCHVVKDVPPRLVKNHVKELKQLFQEKVNELMDASYGVELKNLSYYTTNRFRFTVVFGFKRLGREEAMPIIEKIVDICINILLIRNTERTIQNIQNSVLEDWAVYNKKYPKL